MNYLNITYPDVNNGSGCRVTLWVAGCLHHCPHCHNPESWDNNNGELFDEKVFHKLIEILKLDYISGLTLSGGDPLDILNAGQVLAIMKAVKTHVPGKTIWLYTGHVWEWLVRRPTFKELLQYTDVLVDGLYKHELRDTSLAFRGSSNQRIIDVQKSLKMDQVELLNFDE